MDVPRLTFFRDVGVSLAKGSLIPVNHRHATSVFDGPCAISNCEAREKTFAHPCARPLNKTRVAPDLHLYLFRKIANSKVAKPPRSGTDPRLY